MQTTVHTSVVLVTTSERDKDRWREGVGSYGKVRKENKGNPSPSDHMRGGMGWEGEHIDRQMEMNEDKIREVADRESWETNRTEV